MIFDIATAVVLACLALAWWAVSPLPGVAAKAAEGRSTHSAATWLLLAGLVVAVLVVRLATYPLAGLNFASAALLASVGLVLGRELILHQRWPRRALLLAVAVVTATGAYLRADRLSDVIAAGEALQPDVRYYQQQALRTANPFASGYKSPLWPALHAPLVRHASDPNAAMRYLSCGFGVLLIPAATLAMAVLFTPVAGVLVGGMLAVDTWLIDLCCTGLREELGACLWMLILVLLFAGTHRDWRRIGAIGIAGGVLLLLRNLDIAPLLVMLGWAAVRNRWRATQVITAVVLPILIVSPFYVNQYRAFGDPFALEKRDARYHANMEFRGRPIPPGLSMPTESEFRSDLYAGEPLSPMAYLLRYHTPAQFIEMQWAGVSHIVMGLPFEGQTSLWLRLACIAGLIATAICPAQRFAILFVLASAAGMRAHLAALNQLEQRLLLALMIVWLASGWWLVTEMGKRGLRQVENDK